MELLARIPRYTLYPPFAAQLDVLVARCRARGRDYYAISGLRSFDEQATLYAQGRTTPGKIVTNARPGFSSHQYGIAVDFCLDADLARAGLQPAWDIAQYDLLAAEARALGLDAAYYWQTFREGPHVQLDVNARGLSLAALKAEHDRRGMPGVWRLLDQHGPWRREDVSIV